MENTLIFTSEKDVRFGKLLKFIIPTYLTSLFNTVYTIIDTVPFTRALITNFHSLPHLLHLHQTFFLDFAFTSSGFNGKFFSDHSKAISGCVVCKSLNPCRNMYPLQYGHLLPPERVEIRVFHSLPQPLYEVLALSYSLRIFV